MPDKWYDKPVPEMFSTLEPSLRESLQQQRRVYIWASAFSRQPPILERQEAGEKAGKYFVRLALGGPGLELTLPACYQGGGATNLNYGTLSYARETLDHDTGQWAKPSSELKTGFADIKRRICRTMVRRGDGIWIGKEAQDLIDQGLAKIVNGRSR